MTSYQPVAMPAAIGDQQPYNKEPSCTTALLLPENHNREAEPPGCCCPCLSFSLSNEGNNTALQGCKDFSVHVSNALVTWEELYKYYYNFYYCISIFDSRGITVYSWGVSTFLYDFRNSTETI